ncbi:capsular polysaccharide biosynthesis protein [Pontixanthobacter gangjinensis]|uniref:protein-tyrosine-phosphatase n=1 Tax=Christiangramia aestuarii TaxID=1028746 RepID=A0A7M3SWQ9_9FLAO|nr:CpsB/CapC family capsule biosynthesis tyrosine phosphatase [Christiangramia aestuarii]MUP41040.1 histidinol phosphatase [Christiangramia aestuarii]
MFSIFKKKVYLVDLIEGITDFHNHILPGIDDGAKNIEESLQLIKAFAEIGIKDFVATPHVIGDYYPNTPQTISQAYQNLKKNLVDPENTRINYAAEYMMDQHFMDITEGDNILPVCNGKVLVEMSYFQPPLNLNEILFKLQNNSFSPILAHPERYVYYHSKNLSKYADLKSRGCEFQLNMLSLTGHYGAGIQKTAFQLLENNHIDYICSDVHRLDHIDKIKNIKVPKKFVDNIKVVLDKNLGLFN